MEGSNRRDEKAAMDGYPSKCAHTNLICVLEKQMNLFLTIMKNNCQIMKTKLIITVTVVFLES